MFLSFQMIFSVFCKIYHCVLFWLNSTLNDDESLLFLFKVNVLFKLVFLLCGHLQIKNSITSAKDIILNSGFHHFKSPDVSDLFNSI